MTRDQALRINPGELAEKLLERTDLGMSKSPVKWNSKLGRSGKLLTDGLKLGLERRDLALERQNCGIKIKSRAWLRPGQEQ